MKKRTPKLFSMMEKGHHGSRKRYRKLVMSLAVVVVFVTTYALVLPALTLDEQKADETPGIDAGTKVEQSVDNGAPQDGNDAVSEENRSGDADASTGSDADKSGSGDSNSSASEQADMSSSSNGSNDSNGSSESNADSISDSSGNVDADSKVADSKKDKDIKLIEKKTELTFDGDGYKVIAEVGADAKLPADTKLKVTEVKKNTKDENGEKYEYDEYCKKALKAVRDHDGKEAKNQTRKVRLFDISFVSKSVNKVDDSSDSVTVYDDGSKAVVNEDGNAVFVNKDGCLESNEKIKVRIVFDKAVDTNDKGKTRAVHFDEKYEEQTGEKKADVLKTKAEGVKKQKMKETSFESAQFSVYGVVYTVDFSYEHDGQKYDFSIPGGGFITLSDVFKKLNIKDDIGNVENVQFSDPSLVWMGKAVENTTVGGIKEANGLDCEYSKNLTDEQIEKIDKTEISAGDWALISLKPFDTRETLTITMIDGTVYEIKVLDEQAVTETGDLSVDVNNSYIICYEDNGTYYVLKTDGSKEAFTSTSGFDRLGDEYRWAFYYVFKEKDQLHNLDKEYYFIRPVADKTQTIALNEPGETLVQSGTNNIAVIPQDGGGFIFEGYTRDHENDTKLFFNGSEFVGSDQSSSVISIYKQDPLSRYHFTVRTDDPDQGKVSGRNVSGSMQNNVTEFTAESNDSKKNNAQITATAVSHTNQGQNKWVFDYWDMDGKKLDGVGAVIDAGRIDIPSNGSVLTAHFKQNSSYVVPESEKQGTHFEDMTEWLEGIKTRNIPLNEKGCKKTAEVYDYENRIYRVDLTSQSSLTTFDGTIDLGFVLDISKSMLFPAQLDVYKSNIEIYKINQNSTNKNQLEGNGPYYVIADKEQTATVFRLFKSGGDWYTIDASKYVSSNPTSGATKIGSTLKTSWIQDNSGNVYSDSNEKYFYHRGDNQNTKYTIYKDGRPGTNRFDDLTSSMDTTISSMGTLLGLLDIAKNSSQSSDVKIAWTTFHGDTPDQDSSLPHSYIFSSANGYSTAALDAVESNAGGGTSTNLAMTNAKKFNWNDNATRYVVLITDGAPQKSGREIANSTVISAANSLKNNGTPENTNDDVKLITVGLSMGNVDRGRVLLYDLADEVNGERAFYNAEGDSLKNVLLHIMRQIMQDATVVGDVTDTVDEAFYPVDKDTGRPLVAGDKINLEGVKLNSSYSGPDPYGVVQADGKTIKWNNQDFTHNGWHGTVYVKAKEDLLGGNAMETNEGDAQIKAKGYKFDQDDTMIEFKPDSQITNQHFDSTKELTSPRVNVNELSFLHEETEWTVYLGTSVDPKDQLEKLYKNILVEEVIKEDKGADTNGDGLPDKGIASDDNNWYPLTESIVDNRESEAGQDSTRNTFKMNDLLKVLAQGKSYDWWDYSKNEPNWDVFFTKALEGDGITIPYHVYGISDQSNINIKLSKEIVSGEEADLVGKSPHATTVVSSTGDGGKLEPVEKYTLTVLYTPDYSVLPKGQGGASSTDFKVGTYGTMYQGHAAGTETSKNTHLINTFVKGLRITKTDENFANDLNGAEFKLYLTSEACTTVEQVKNSAVDGYPVTMTVSNGHFFTHERLTNPEEGQYCYIVEEKAPAGYEKLAAPIAVNLNITDTYSSNVMEEDEEDNVTDIQADALTNWTQTATISIAGASAGSIPVDVNGAKISGTTADSTTATVYYKVANNPGVELPSAGGPGTTWMYILGMLLTVVAGGALVVRRRMNAAQ